MVMGAKTSNAFVSLGSWYFNYEMEKILGFALPNLVMRVVESSERGWTTLNVGGSTQRYGMWWLIHGQYSLEWTDACHYGSTERKACVRKASRGQIIDALTFPAAGGVDTTL